MQTIFSYIILALLILSSFFSSAQDCQNVPFEEKNGLLVVEIESVPLKSGWKKETNANGFTGNAYYRWDGGNKLTEPGNGTLEYKIKINTPGIYRFQMHMKVGSGSSNTDSNDSWLKIPDADDFFGEHNNGSIVRPHGVCTDDCPNGQGKEGWFKMYSAGTTDWTWKTLTSDRSGHKIYADFSKAGVYTVLVSGRSEDHLIDRFIMYNSSKTENQATNLNNPETLCESTTSLEDNWGFVLTSVFPNPGNGKIQIGLNAKTPGIISMAIHNLIGQEIYRESWNANGGEQKKALDLSHLDNGMYILSLFNQNIRQSKMIIKQ